MVEMRVQETVYIGEDLLAQVFMYDVGPGGYVGFSTVCGGVTRWICSGELGAGRGRKLFPFADSGI
jgi:hypothetical protein